MSRPEALREFNSLTTGPTRHCLAVPGAPGMPHAVHRRDGKELTMASVSVRSFSACTHEATRKDLPGGTIMSVDQTRSDARLSCEHKKAETSLLTGRLVR